MGVSRPHPARGRILPLLALGLSLARGGPMATVAIVLGALITIGTITAAFVIARSGGHAPLVQLPSTTARLLAWGAGVLLAFASGAHALRRDRAEGIRDLLRARGGGTMAYLFARIAGLVVLLALVVGGGTLLSGVAATTLAGAQAGRVAQGTLAALLYAFAFACTVGPLALAALGARSRAGGYLVLVGVLILPEMLEAWTSPMMPAGWEDLASIPSALTALRTSLMPPGADGGKLGRAVVILGVVVFGAIAMVRSQLARLDAEAAP